MTPLFPAGAALVVGGSGGVGQAICETLARDGSDVILTCRQHRARADEVAARITALGRRALVLPYQAAAPGAANALLHAGLDAFPRIHTVVNAAGSDIPMRFISEVTPQSWADVVEADLNGFFDLVHASLPHLRQQGGSLVQVSSIGIRRWPKRDVLSVAPKAAIEQLLRGIAREEGRFGIRANSVQLGVIDAGLFHRLRQTDFDEAWVDAARRNTALQRFGSPGDVAEAVAFLASSKAAYITGESIRLDGGFSL